MTLEEAKSRLMTCITDCGDCFCCADHDTAVSVVLEELDNRESGWISTADRLPEEFEPVLILVREEYRYPSGTGNLLSVSYRIYTGWRYVADWGDSLWITNCFYRENEIRDCFGFQMVVTHWQSLPEPPKEVEHE